MRSTRRKKIQMTALAVAATGLMGGAVATAAGTSYSGTAAAESADRVVQVAAGHSSSAFRGTFRQADGCPYLVTQGGAHYYLPGYTLGGNGALYKKGGGFIAYPGWKIQANGTKQYKPLGNSTTLCATWGDARRIKARSIYALEH
ncbi:hypothetical protein ACIF6K_30970 [Streptomyces sp. NPDC085942]|uniref:hypothetical protein n=1 Tax=Streptomyces sp. NPDC085942 TaxID=3365743 RepID=UPI0037CD4F08